MISGIHLLIVCRCTQQVQLHLFVKHFCIHPTLELYLKLLFSVIKFGLCFLSQSIIYRFNQFELEPHLTKTQSSSRKLFFQLPSQLSFQLLSMLVFVELSFLPLFAFAFLRETLENQVGFYQPLFLQFQHDDLYTAFQ